jgi:anti-anti-sigma regulatory factor
MKSSAQPQDARLQVRIDSDDVLLIGVLDADSTVSAEAAFDQVRDERILTIDLSGVRDIDGTGSKCLFDFWIDRVLHGVDIEIIGFPEDVTLDP